MSLELYKTHNSNTPDEEYISIYAKEDVNLKGYAVVDKTFFNSSGKISNQFRHIYEFSSLDIKQGEYIRLHSGKGEYKKSPNKVDTFTHHIYWNSEECIWNDNGDMAILIKYAVVEQMEVKAINNNAR